MNAIDKYNRLENIKNLIFKNKRIMTDDIVETLKVSYPTARRYMQALILSDNSFSKIRNGIMLKTSSTKTEHVFSEKINIRIEQKKAIAKKCASLISNGESILIDSGTTCYFLAKELYQSDLNVITTDLKISMELSNKKKISLYTIGGQVRYGYYSIGGAMARDNLLLFNVETAIMSADAIDIDKGITNTEMFEVSVKKEIKKCSKKIILLADSTKFNIQTLHFIMPITDIDIIITDSEISKETINQVEKNNIKLIIA